MLKVGAFKVDVVHVLLSHHISLKLSLLLADFFESHSYSLISYALHRKSNSG